MENDLENETKYLHMFILSTYHDLEGGRPISNRAESGAPVSLAQRYLAHAARRHCKLCTGDLPKITRKMSHTKS